MPHKKSDDDNDDESVWLIKTRAGHWFCSWSKRMTKKLIKRNAFFLARGVEKFLFKRKPLGGRSLPCSIKDGDGDCNPDVIQL